jgi:ATP-dependent helicase HrpA
MVAELVETSRLWGARRRRSTRAGSSRSPSTSSRQYSEPSWDRKRGSAVAKERVTLYGLPIVTGRRVAYHRIDPALSRELFIRRALVDGEWDTRHHFMRDNAALVAEVHAIEERARRRDVLVDDQALFAFFDARIERTWSPPRTSTAGGATSAAAGPTCSRTRTTCSCATTRPTRSTSGRRRARGARASSCCR